MITAAWLFLKGFPTWVWQLLGLLLIVAGVFFSGAHWQGKRDQVEIEALKQEHATFVAGVKAQGEQAKKDAEAREAADKVRKEKADAENKAALASLAADNDRLRKLGARGSTVPSAPAGSSRPELACFDRAELGAAVDDFVGEISGQAQSGAAATVNLNTAKGWAQSGK